MADYVETKRQLQLRARKIIVDDVNGDGTLVYTGWMAQGADESKANAFISKTVVVAGPPAVTTVTHSEPGYESEWDERAGTVTYS